MEALWNMMQNKQVKGNTKIIKQKIYFSLQGTTLILWFPLILMSLVEVVFSCRCFLACTSFLRLRCPWRRNIRVNGTTCSDTVPAYFFFFLRIYLFLLGSINVSLKVDFLYFWTECIQDTNQSLIWNHFRFQVMF